MGNAPFELLLHGHDAVECSCWRQEDEENRVAWAASGPQVPGRARQPAARARTAAPAKHPTKSEKVSRAKDMTPHTNRGVRSLPRYRPRGSTPHAV